MTKGEYVVCNQQGRFATFKLTSGISINGMISDFFPDEPETYYYVATGNMQAFKSLLEKKQFAEMKQLCVQINPSNIISAELIK
ncbi:MAG: hypothetical protein ACJ76F_06245 [Bacteroidia bacterium]